MALQRWDMLRLALAVAGLGIMGYLTLVHYQGEQLLVCPSGGQVINCHAVLNSPQSVLMGIPISIFGAAWFVVAGALATASLARRGDEPPLFSNLSLVWTLSGTLAVLYLVYIELGVLHSICLWCTAAHVCMVLILVIQVLTQPARTQPSLQETSVPSEEREDDTPSERVE